MIKKLIIILVYFFIPELIFANFDFNKNCNNTFKLILDLQFDEAIKFTKVEKQINPDNKLVYYFDNYVYFLKTIASDSENDYLIFKNKFDFNYNKLKKANQNSPYFLYTQADIHFQSAILSYKFKDFILASYHFYKAYKLISLNFKKHPDFYQNYKLTGSFNLLLASIPQNYEWFKNLFNINGNINLGIKELEYYYLQSKNSAYNTESIILLSFAYQHFLSNNKRAYIFLNHTNQINLQNPLICFLYANSCVKVDKNNEAIAVSENCLKNSKIYTIKYLYYFLGIMKLNRLDNDADIYFFKYLDLYKGKNYIKSSYQKLAWYYLINKDYLKYNIYFNKVKQLGFVNTEADKQAYIEANQSVKINKELLKARLLFDGGNFAEAEQLLLKNSDISNNKSKKDNIEYLYRLARIFHKKNRLEEAKQQYELVISKGSELPYYYAKNSALQLALIYENENDFKYSDFYFHKSLSIKSNEYKNSINFNAKSGLNRIHLQN
ncbi:MAG: tetratricopeptide repeat protein [Bacteroidetes bacterium]|nr:tetratricopeptide repeat protein [Bacteroidota bacterium]